MPSKELERHLGLRFEIVLDEATGDMLAALAGMSAQSLELEAVDLINRAIAEEAMKMFCFTKQTHRWSGLNAEVARSLHDSTDDQTQEEQG